VISAEIRDGQENVSRIAYLSPELSMGIHSSTTIKMCDVINVFDVKRLGHGMETWAIIPVKRLDEAKSSLGIALTPKQRRELVLCMLTDVLNAVHNSRLIAGAAVVSPDEVVLNFARVNDAIDIAEPGVGLNEALKLAIEHTATKGTSSVLILPSDLPLLRASDIENIISLASSPRDIVIAPSKNNGTNALFLRPPDVMNLRFGGESFPVHLAEARGAGISPHIYRSFNVATDIDVVEDLSKAETHGLGTRTQSFLQPLR